MSQPPPSPVAVRPPAAQVGLPYGRPVRRRVMVPVLLAIGIAAVASLVILHDPVVYYRVASGSMEPTLAVGARVAVEHGLTPKVGEMVAFHAPAGAVPATPVCGNPGEGAGFAQPCGRATPTVSRVVFVKRIVAGPGDAVLIRGGRAVVNGVAEAAPFPTVCGGPDCNFTTPVRVPAGEYYVLGDNRGASDDSRFWGPVPASAIVGVLVTCAPVQTACQPRH